MRSDWRLDFGAAPTPEGVRFRVWAPRARSLAVKLGREVPPIPLLRDARDVFQVLVPGARVGVDYRYVVDEERERPDPVSRHQPHGVHGPSRVVDPRAFAWSDDAWRGLPLEEYVLYELHVGTFTAGGTFEDAIARLRCLRDLGVTAVELMPVGEFPGGRNWGYDGVQLYAPQSTYGGPEGLKKLVDACHREGLAVVLDAVYNHIGPEGNYLAEYGPYFSSNYRTPWGDAINFDGPESDGVRRFFIDNALYWVTEYHVDALRLDAVHGIFDFSARHILEEIGAEVHAEAKHLGRDIWLIAESDLNDVRVINPPELGGHGMDAQWSDDFHHSLHTLVTGKTRGYFSDFGKMDDLRKAIAAGFVYDGKRSGYRRRRHGSSSAGRPGRQFVVFTQNHDQVANGSGGDRISVLTSLEHRKLEAAVLLCTPNLPMLFMGQEYGETAPFYYFTSHGDPALVEAVRKGRREEFESFHWGREFPDPQGEDTFLRSKLDWSLREQPAHAALLRFYEDLLALRAKHPSLRNLRKDLTNVSTANDARWLVVERNDPQGEVALCVFNFRTEPQEVPLPVYAHRWQRVLDGAEPRYRGAGEFACAPEILERDSAGLWLSGLSLAIYIGGNR